MFALPLLWPLITGVLGKLTLKDICYLVTILLVIFVCAFIWYKGEQHGKNVIINQVDKQNEAAKNAADAAGLTVDQCYNAGMRWEQSTGKCSR